MKYKDPEGWARFKDLANKKKHLQDQLSYVWKGEKNFIPKHTKFVNVTTMAGQDARTEIRDIDRLVSAYGGTAVDWKKQAGKVSSDKYIFDVHWYKRDDGIQHDMKLKSRSERKK